MIEAEIRDIVADLIGKPGASIPSDARLEGSGVDSLGLIHLTVDLEERFGIAFPPEETLPDLPALTLADLAALVERLIDAGDRR